MIKVNLLATNPGVAAPREWLPREQRSALGGVGVLVVTALALGGYWYYQGVQRAAIETQIAAAQAELTRLKDAADLVERTNARRTELTERLALIERLRASKRAPVSLLETVSYSVPEGLWLMEIKQAGATVQVAEPVRPPTEAVQPRRRRPQQQQGGAPPGPPPGPPR